MRLTDLLDRPIAFHRCLAELAGSVNAGLMLSQALYWSKRTKDNEGWFYKTREEWQEETYLKRTEQETARKALKGSGCWQEELRGVPAKLYFRVDFDRLEELLITGHVAETPPSSKQETRHPVGRNPANKKAEILPTFLLAETTTEITTKSKARSGSTNPYYDCFAACYLELVKYPYSSQKADFVQLAKWKTLDEDRTSLKDFGTAVRNYLFSPQGKYTLADLVTRFAVFRNSALDRFGKPVESRTPPTPSSAAPLPPSSCEKCVEGWIMPTEAGGYAQACQCSNS